MTALNVPLPPTSLAKPRMLKRIGVFVAAALLIGVTVIAIYLYGKQPQRQGAGQPAWTTVASRGAVR